MKSDLWVVIAVTAAFVGFLIGYSLPPLVETGMLTGDEEQVGLTPELNKDMEKYYRDLLEE